MARFPKLAMDFVVSFYSGNIQKRKAGFQAAFRQRWAGLGQGLGSIGQYLGSA